MDFEQKQKAIQSLTKIVKAARRAQRTGKFVALNKLMEQATKISEKIDDEDLDLRLQPPAPINNIQFSSEDDNLVFKQVKGEIVYEIVDEFQDSLKSY